MKNKSKMKLLPPRLASEYVGVCPETLRVWERAGKLKPMRTAGGHRRYKLTDLDELIERSDNENQTN